ncbi:Aste57867_22149 [Aphanomyces stellatus]|uniref:Aste57867_22149 protein n=1 Tax=Aphanomyces stellatus TaxID=120398 RepID=A0A485LKR8_9STRA|nr:hypothetical protein As57867_022080 [Aphanomyces stellatus]VFT98816.1 Aste57867_22149 [Aphanomyces stellatus]
MTYNAKEYLRNDLEEYCASLGIEQLYTTSYSPEENCIAEKSNYTIMNKVRCLLQESGLEVRYWGEVLNCVVCTENRSPTMALNGRAPFEVLHGHNPMSSIYAHLDALVLPIDKSKRTKLDPKATKCILLGYANQHKSYRLVSCEICEVFESRRRIHQPVVRQRTCARPDNIPHVD